MKIISARRFALFWRLAQRWFKAEHKSIKDTILEAIDGLFVEATETEIDDMFVGSVSGGTISISGIDENGVPYEGVYVDENGIATIL